MTEELKPWECLRDSSYYDMWLVRQVGDRQFGQGFHLVNGDEATALCDLLNRRAPDPAERIDAARMALEHVANMLGFNSFLAKASNPYDHTIGGAMKQIENAIRAIDPAQFRERG